MYSIGCATFRGFLQRIKKNYSNPQSLDPKFQAISTASSGICLPVFKSCLYTYVLYIDIRSTRRRSSSVGVLLRMLLHKIV